MAPICCTRSFLEDVKTDSRLQRVLDKLNLRIEIDDSPKWNAVLKATKKRWDSPEHGPKNECVNVHLELRYHGQVHLDVEISPYEAWISRKPERMKELDILLKLKAELHRTVRQGFESIQDKHPRLRITTKHVRNSDGPSTCTAVKFGTPTDKEVTPQEHAKFFAIVVKDVTPIVDRLVRTFKATRKARQRRRQSRGQSRR